MVYASVSKTDARKGLRVRLPPPAPASGAILAPSRGAAAELGANRSSIHRYIRAGKLAKYREALDQRTYIDRDELRRLLEFRQVPEKES
jgi:hypothetical protein